jgi:hypothetical protein
MESYTQRMERERNERHAKELEESHLQLAIIQREFDNHPHTIGKMEVLHNTGYNKTAPIAFNYVVYQNGKRVGNISRDRSGVSGYRWTFASPYMPSSKVGGSNPSLYRKDLLEGLKLAIPHYRGMNPKEADAEAIHRALYKLNAGSEVQVSSLLAALIASEEGDEEAKLYVQKELEKARLNIQHAAANNAIRYVLRDGHNRQFGVAA